MPLPPNLMPSNPNIFANNPLDRASQLRRNADWLKTQLNDPKSLLVLFHNGNPLISRKGERVEIVWLRPNMGTNLGARDAALIFLGLDEKKCAYFALELGRVADPTKGGMLDGFGEFVDLRQVALELAPDEAAILAQAKALLHWHAQNVFCALTGEPTEIRDGGYRRVTADERSELFPRTDPVVIMLAMYGDEILLARQPRFPANLYSAPAGFMEPGESIEEAAARELMEEVGIPVSEVIYHSSQPWPFPSSLMIGCHAKALSREITLDRQELEDARWFTRDEIALALKGEGPVRVPARHAIGHHLIKDWLNKKI